MEENRRNVNRKRPTKHITLDPETVEIIEQFCVIHGLNFSRAIESLALLGLNNTEVIGQAKFMKAVVETAVLSQLDRFAKLIAHAGIEAGSARQGVERLLFWQMIDRAQGVLNLEDYEATLVTDPDSPIEPDVYRLFKRNKGRHRYRAVLALRNFAKEFPELFVGLDEEGEKWEL